MNKYELALVVTAKIDDNARAEVVEKAKGYITRANGVIVGIEEWGKKRLAYEIQYQREAYYYFIHFEAEPEVPGVIERDLRIMDNVLRYLVVRQDDDFVMPEQKSEEAPVEEAAESTEAVEEVAAEETVAEQ